jgi:hypothetical protein
MALVGDMRNANRILLKEHPRKRHLGVLMWIGEE